MNITSFIAALFLLAFAVFAGATPMELRDLTADELINLQAKDSGITESYGFLEAASFAGYVATNPAHVSFEKGQYVKLDTTSSKSKNINAIEPNSVYIFMLGLLALFFVRRNQAKLK